MTERQLLRHPCLYASVPVNTRETSHWSITNWPHADYEPVVLCDDLPVEPAAHDYPGDHFLLLPRGGAQAQIRDDPGGATGLLRFQHACGKTLSVPFQAIRCEENHHDGGPYNLDLYGDRDRESSVLHGRGETADTHHVKIALASQIYYGDDADKKNQLGRWDEPNAPSWIDDFMREGWLTDAWQDPCWTRVFKPLWGVHMRSLRHRFGHHELLWLWSEERDDCNEMMKHWQYERQRRIVAEKVLHALASDDMFNDVSARQAVLNAFKAAFPTLESTEPTMPPDAALQSIQSIRAAVPAGEDAEAAAKKYRRD